MKQRGSLTLPSPAGGISQSDADARYFRIANNLSEGVAATMRTSLGLGSIATQAAGAVAITGGTLAGITGAGFRDTSAAFDVSLVFTSAIPLDAGRTVTVDVGNANRSIHISGDGTLAMDERPNSFTAIQTIAGAGLKFIDDQSAPQWAMTGLRLYETPGTLTDTTSSGTVAAACTNKLGGNTIAASSATTFTDYFSTYVTSPVAGTNVTLTSAWALGADSLYVGTSNPFKVAANGAVTVSAAGAASSPPLYLTGALYTGGSGTTTFPHFFHQPTGATAATTWSSGSNNGTVYGANEASGFTGNFSDFRTAGLRKFVVDKTGCISTAVQGGDASTFDSLGGGSLLVHTNNTTNGVRIYYSISLNWGGDLLLWRGAAGTLEQRNSTNAQTLRLYGTYTDASNYTRMSLAATSTTMTIACETAGTGADNIDLGLTPAGTGLVAFSNAASVDAAVVSTHTARVKFNGTEYKVLLATP